MESGSKDDREAIQVYARDPELEAERARAAQLHADLPIWMYGASPEQYDAFLRLQSERKTRAVQVDAVLERRAAKLAEVCACGTQPVDGVCSWIVNRYVPAIIDSLREGEFICRWNQDQPRVGVCRIESIEWARQDYEPPPGFRLKKSATIGIAIRYQTGTVKKSSFTVHEGARIKVLRAVPCGVGVCWMCGREPADGVRVCEVHRDSWKNVA